MNIARYRNDRTRTIKDCLFQASAPAWRLRRRPCHALAMLVALGIFLVCTAVHATDKQDLSVRQRHVAQQQARAMAIELVTSILDVQLRQFQENKLDQLPAYLDIQAMRRNLDELVEKDMQSVVDLLAKAEGAGEADRQAAVQEARTKGRAVVVALLAEQQRLRQRMRLAKIAAQIRQLIDLESSVLDQTRQLPEKPPADREDAVLEQIEDQRDIAVLHAQLLATLREVAQWKTSVSEAAEKGLSLLVKQQIEQELKQVDTALHASRYADAERAEETAIKAWRAVLDMIELAQGLMHGDQVAMAKDVAALIQKQTQLRDETQTANLDDQSQSEQLADKQHEVHEQLNQLSEKLAPNPDAEALSKQAADAAYEAETDLFEGKQQPALQQQEQVMEALQQLSKNLEQADQRTVKPTSDQLAGKEQPSEKAAPANAPQKTDGESTGKPTAKPSNLAQQSAKKNGQPTDQQMRDTGDSIPSGNQSQSGPQSGTGGKSSPRSVETEPWFAKLPPAVQQSIQARSRPVAPRGYEERLKRYFESN